MLMQRLRNHLVLACLAISVIFIVVATLLYPGGSLYNNTSPGFDWTKNFFSNLFAEKAINGADNPGRIWAVIGIAFHSVGNGVFFLNMARRMPARQASVILTIIGTAAILFNSLVATPLHDLVVTVSSTLSLLGLFYITVFIFRSRLHLFKAFCIVAMLVFYATLFLYGSGYWGLLAIMQKVSFFFSLSLVLSLSYFTTAADFLPVKRNAGASAAIGR